MKKTTYSEHEDQVAVYQFCLHMSSVYPALALIYAIPNGFSAKQSARRYMASEGLRPGFPDLGLPVARCGYNGLFIEMKRKGGDNPKPEQVKWLVALANQGYLALCCKGREAAQDILIKYVKGVPFDI